MSIDQYSYLWDGSSSSWALLHVNFDKIEEEPKYLVVNLDTRRALLIQDNETSEKVKKYMLSRNVQVVSPKNGF